MLCDSYIFCIYINRFIYFIERSITMKKYLVTTYATATYKFIVEADSKEEAEEKVWAGDYDELNNGDPIKIEDEQIESIVEN